MVLSLLVACADDPARSVDRTLTLELTRDGRPTTCEAESAADLVVDWSGTSLEFQESIPCRDGLIFLVPTGADTANIGAYDADGALLASRLHSIAPQNGHATARVEFAEVCDQAGDEEGDLQSDCADPDCAAHAACRAEDCYNGADDDGDRDTDCADADCAQDCTTFEIGWSVTSGGEPATCEAAGAGSQVVIQVTDRGTPGLIDPVPCTVYTRTITVPRSRWVVDVFMNLPGGTSLSEQFTTNGEWGPVETLEVVFDVPATAECPDHLVISEIGVAPDAGHPGDVYVELYNPTPAPLAITSFEYTLLTATSSGPLNLVWYSPQVELPAGGHYLAVGQMFRPGGDAIFSGGAEPIPSEGTVQLVSSSSVVVDSVSWSADGTVGATPGEGAPIVFAAPSTSALERLPGGAGGSCQDTDDNAADFHVVPRDPQSMASPPTP
jgi:hypothetical protein